MKKNWFPMALWVALVVFVLLTVYGCATGTVHRDARAGDRNSKLASKVLGFASGRACDLFTLQCDNILWRQTGWNRIDDLTEPMYVVVAGDGTACVIWELLVYVPEHDHYWNCQTDWRMRSAR